MTWGEGIFGLVLLIFLIVRFFVLPAKKDFDGERQDDTRPD
jgi:hypothetical protein